MTKKPQHRKMPPTRWLRTSVARHGRPIQRRRKIRIVLAGLRGEESISVLCRREGIAESLFYSWSKEFLEARETYGIPQTDSTGFASQAGLAGRLSFRGPAHARSAALDQISLLSCSGRQYFHIVRLSSQAPALDCALLF